MIFDPLLFITNKEEFSLIWISFQSINQTSIAPISPAKPGSVTIQPNQCSTAKSRKQFHNINRPFIDIKEWTDAKHDCKLFSAAAESPDENEAYSWLSSTMEVVRDRVSRNQATV